MLRQTIANIIAITGLMYIGLALSTSKFMKNKIVYTIFKALQFYVLYMHKPSSKK